MSNGLPSASKRASLYAALHTGTPGDRDYYARQCRGARAILELGCGAGRILRSLEPSALRVGLDLEIERLRLAQQIRAPEGSSASRLHWICGDMRDFQLDRRFDRILLPYTGVYCLATDDEMRSCFEQVRAHLTADGRFVFDAYCADGLHASEPNAEQPEGGSDDEAIATVEVDGTTYFVREETEWDPKRQQLDVVYVYEPRSGGHSIAEPIRHHYLRLDQLAPLLASAGLELISLEGDFAGTPANSESDHYVAVTRRC